MDAILTTYLDGQFVDSLASLAPAVGGGLILGICVALVGWVWGLVVRLGKIEV